MEWGINLSGLSMRNKLFFAFMAVILIALVSNLLFYYLINRDFEDYVIGTQEDKLYWVLASVEGAYSEGEWDHRTLHETIHWAIMLGFDIKVLNAEDQEIMDSDMVLSMLTPSMARKMKNIYNLMRTTGSFENFPLYSEGKEIGSMLVRKIEQPAGMSRMEQMFKQRGKSFLLISFLIAGSGAILLSVFFALFLSGPLKKMKGAVETMALRDFSVRLPVTSHDEIGDVSKSFNFMAEALEREEALRKHLTSNIAHELRTPLSIMKANVEAMVDGVVEDRERGLQNIQAEVERLIRLVQGIEDVTKAEASFFTAKDYASVDLKDFIGMIAGKMRPLASARGADIIITGTDNFRVQTDADKLERILQNILSNSIRHTKNGAITIHYGARGNLFFVKIKDTGTGMEKKTMDLIFRRFYRGSDSEGLGLGLAIVKELTEVLGGRIDVESNPGEGTEFTVLLPRDGNA
jgi:two-component system, OmpR family, sensor histidine kinase BaeS